MTLAEGKLWKELAKAREKLLACYRTGMQPSEKLLQKLRDLRQQLEPEGTEK